MDGSLKFIVIKTKEQGMFISDNIQGSGYFSSKIPNLFFDGEKLVTTFKKDWYKLDKSPQKIEVKGKDDYTNRRYELKAGFPVSDLTPQTISYNDWDDKSEISGLYSLKYDIAEGVLESVEFEIELLSEEDNFYIEKPKYPSTPNLIDSLTVHPALHLERPSSISGVDLYKVVREFIKLNINQRHAKITSDYDFCFTVQKVIVHDPESYTVDVGKRKPKLETRYRRNRAVTIFECAPKTYNGYTVLKGVNGKNQKDLEDKIERYLEETIEMINKPLIECTCCNGLGVILDTISPKKE